MHEDIPQLLKELGVEDARALTVTKNSANGTPLHHRYTVSTATERSRYVNPDTAQVLVDQGATDQRPGTCQRS